MTTQDSPTRRNGASPAATSSQASTVRTGNSTTNDNSIHNSNCVPAAPATALTTAPTVHIPGKGEDQCTHSSDYTAHSPSPSRLDSCVYNIRKDFLQMEGQYMELQQELQRLRTERQDVGKYYRAVSMFSEECALTLWSLHWLSSVCSPSHPCALPPHSTTTASCILAQQFSVRVAAPSEPAHA